MVDVAVPRRCSGAAVDLRVKARGGDPGPHRGLRLRRPPDRACRRRASTPTRWSSRSTSPYQRIVITRTPSDQFQLFLNGNLQFSSRGRVPLPRGAGAPGDGAGAATRAACSSSGGGDGLAVREILKHPRVSEVVLVDLDPEMTRLAVENPLLVGAEPGVAARPARARGQRGRVRLAGAGRRSTSSTSRSSTSPTRTTSRWASSTRGTSTRCCARRLDPAGVVAVQSTSPLMARQSFWCINRTLEAAGFHVRPYHALVPSFGEWGFALASLRAGRRVPASGASPGLRYLDAPTLASLFVLGPDMARGGDGGQPPRQPGAGPLLRGRVAEVELTVRQAGRRWLVAARSALIGFLELVPGRVRRRRLGPMTGGGSS